MATSVSNAETMELRDGTEVVLRPLVIKQLRKFMKEFRKMGDDIEFPEGATDEEKAEISQEIEYDQLIYLTGIALEDVLKKKVTEDAENVEEAKEMYTAYLESNLDMPAIFKVFEVCASMKLDDPNLLAAAAASLAETGGKTSTS